MTSTAWDVLDETQRPQWDCTPLETVGPLRFGMTPAQVEEAVAGLLTVNVSGGWSGHVDMILFELAGRTSFSPAVTTYFADAGGLACVVVHALAGPQVTLGGLRLVAQDPSLLQDRFFEYVAAYDDEPLMSGHGDPGSEVLGLVIRSQRAGDMQLTRPVFVAPEWAERCCHPDEGRIPPEEWTNFSW